MKRAFITGISGQAASYLSEILLERNYEVYGLIRHSTMPREERTQYVPSAVRLIDGDILDFSSLVHALRIAKPDEIYNLAAQSFVGSSWDLPIITTQTNGLGVLNLLEAMRQECKDAKMYQASSSEMYGVSMGRIEALTPFAPVSPYAAAKVFAHHMCQVYRRSHNMFVSCGICFNHESPRRGLQFVTRKITDGVARIKLGLTDKIHLGNLEAKRDWSHAKDTMMAAWVMLQDNQPDDYIVASGSTWSVREFCDRAFVSVGLDYHDYIVSNTPELMRPTEVPYLLGDSTKIRRDLGWQPAYTFADLVEEMVASDLERLKNA